MFTCVIRIHLQQQFFLGATTQNEEEKKTELARVARSWRGHFRPLAHFQTSALPGNPVLEQYVYSRTSRPGILQMFLLLLHPLGNKAAGRVRENQSCPSIQLSQFHFWNRRINVPLSQSAPLRATGHKQSSMSEAAGDIFAPQVRGVSRPSISLDLGSVMP